MTPITEHQLLAELQLSYTYALARMYERNGIIAKLLSEHLPGTRTLPFGTDHYLIAPDLLVARVRSREKGHAISIIENPTPNARLTEFVQTYHLITSRAPVTFNRVSIGQLERDLGP